MPKHPSSKHLSRPDTDVSPDARLVQQDTAARAARWLAENGAALATSNADADARELPLAFARLL